MSATNVCAVIPDIQDALKNPFDYEIVRNACGFSLRHIDGNISRLLNADQVYDLFNAFNGLKTRASS